MEGHHQYDNSSMADLCCQLMNGRPTHVPPISPPANMFSSHQNFSPGGQQQYEIMKLGRQVGEIIPLGAAADSTAAGFAVMNSCGTGGKRVNNFEVEACCFNGGTGRWPRQETVTLLEIRSRLHSKFKEANQKAPVWDEISRIMYEEHGYQRSAKKCKEKFENLYKYYKKTKDGKAGRQDGKHYRFFRQLEALYGDRSTSNTPAASVQENQFVSNSTTPMFRTAIKTTSTPTNHKALNSQQHWDSISLSKSLGLESSSSDDNDLSPSSLKEKENEFSVRRRKRRGPSKWRAKIKDFIDSQMKKLIEKQDAWFEKMMKTLEQKEHDRLRKEEEWKKQEAARLEREHKFWAKERAWIEARDAALMEALHKFTGREVNAMICNSEENIATDRSHIIESFENQHDDGSDQTIHNSIIDNTSGEQRWSDSEIARLIELRTGIESRIQRSGCSEELLWEEIAARMACLGYHKNAVMCKEKWDSICNDYARRSRNESSKKRKENLRCYSHFQHDNSIFSEGGVYTKIVEQGHDDSIARLQVQTDDGSSSLSCNFGNAMPDNGLHFLMGMEKTSGKNMDSSLTRENTSVLYPSGGPS